MRRLPINRRIVDRVCFKIGLRYYFLNDKIKMPISWLTFRYMLAGMYKGQSFMSIQRDPLSSVCKELSYRLGFRE